MQPSNILKIETLTEDWCDKDVVMLHACFQLLVDCVEKENLLNGHADWNHDEEYKQARTTIENLYKWWLTRRIKYEKSDLNDLDQLQYAEDNERLVKLIGVRKYLWT